MRQPMSVRLLLLQPRPSLVMRFESTTLLSMTFDTPAADIAFLRSIYETERQADFDRANPAAYAAFTGAAYIDFSDQD